ncbi:MAG: porin family protein, partial [Gammaproteobacteria bacterium]|nr:porin family protein [Gammaproteobacteria bacterium]
GGDTDYGDGDSGFTVTTGYRFSPGFAIEASYTDSGTPQWDEGAVFITSLGDTFDVSADIDMTSTQVSLVGLVPFGDNWDFYVRGGIVFWDAESKQRLRRVSDSELITRTIDEDGEEFVLGIGMGVTVRESWYLRADYAVFEIDDEVLALAFDEDANARILSFQLIYRFGQRGPTSGPLQTPRTER